MATSKQKPKLIVIVGPTASGKSALAMKLAKRYSGEIIAADSRTIYKDMDIGTAKPTRRDRAEVPHFGLDLVKPGQRFTAYDFKRYAELKIAEIEKRGGLPLLVGGTGLYIDSVLFDFELRSDRNILKRKMLGLRSISNLQKIIQAKGYPMPENALNKRHLVRAIETRGRSGTRKNQPPSETYIVGILPADNVLKQNIEKRAGEIFKSGVLEETKLILRKYGRRQLKRSAGIIYPICLKIIDGDINEKQALELFKKADWQYARRQRTWFKRNKYIHWFESVEVAYTSVSKLLNN